ncbi:hypothetical protein THAOC_00839, partial [Thalassiosira oceanica]
AVHGTFGASSAICGNHIMRAGKHWATFVLRSEDAAYPSVGVIRPLPGWDQRRMEFFHPSFDESFRDDLRRERTSRWEGDVHFCHFYQSDGGCFYSNWEGEGESIWEGVDNYDKSIHTLGLLLDLDSGLPDLGGAPPIGLKRTLAYYTSLKMMVAGESHPCVPVVRQFILRTTIIQALVGEIGLSQCMCISRTRAEEQVGADLNGVTVLDNKSKPAVAMPHYKRGTSKLTEANRTANIVELVGTHRRGL